MKQIITIIISILLLAAVSFNVYTSYQTRTQLQTQIDTLSMEKESAINSLSSDVSTLRSDFLTLSNSVHKNIEELSTELTERLTEYNKQNRTYTIISDNDHYIYYMQEGDTIGGIAQAFNVPLDLLIARNNIADVHNIKIGAQIIIPKD